jgi:hypothetical protein
MNNIPPRPLARKAPTSSETDCHRQPTPAEQGLSDDRAWFKSHPHRRYRVRFAYEGERPDCGPGDFVIVGRIGAGRILRFFWHGIGTPPARLDMSDAKIRPYWLKSIAASYGGRS